LLDRWGMGYERSGRPVLTPDGRGVPEYLDELEQKLDRAARGDKRRPDVGVAFYLGLRLGERDLDRAQRLYYRLVGTGGTGHTYTQQGLLELIGRAALPASVPFWEGLVDFKGTRDRFVSERRKHALAGLALLVRHHDLEPARDALLRLVQHIDPEVRRRAVDMLLRSGPEPDAPVPDQLVALLREVALGDQDSLVRFFARSWLWELGREVPMDHPGGVYRFQVLPAGDRKAELVVDVRSDQTLADLHAAIQQGLRWDDDHLYAFYISGKAFDQDTALSGPAEVCEPPHAAGVPLGQLGLVPGGSFLYLFDFGDQHEMPIKVLEVQEEAGRGPYPKIVKKPPRPPEQYPSW